MTDDDQKPEKELSEFESLDQEAEMGILAEFWLFIREEKKWWLTPIVIMLLLIAVLAVLTQSGAAPFIYTLF